LGFKFGFYATKQETPANFYRLVATLIKNGLMQLGDIFVHVRFIMHFVNSPQLSPNDTDAMLKEQKQFVEAKLKSAREMGRLSIDTVSNQLIIV
jgi:hypothetical protein